MRKLSIFLAAALAAAGTVHSVQAQEIVRADGSSTVFPITEAIAEEFQIHTVFRMTVGVSGTGGGFSRFCRGETDVTGASRPISEDERNRCAAQGISYYEIPVGMDAIAVTVNPGNDWVDHLTVEELRVLWEPAAEGEILSWNQVRDSFPDRPIRLYGAGTDSGTYDYFTAAVVGREHASRGDFTASEDDNILVQGVANDPNGLAFFGLAYYLENQSILRAVPIAQEGGAPVAPSVENAESGVYQPLTRPIFLYVKRSSYEESEAVRSLIDDFLLNAGIMRTLVAEVGYVPLPPAAFELVAENVRNGETGTVFTGGSQIGVSIEDLLRAERQD